ncbi:MAG: lysine--tRNA ligase [Acetobacteraceae bacterium]|nr:lysine--tRNA ligase [Acetobacteraceae bacterium]
MGPRAEGPDGEPSGLVAARLEKLRRLRSLGIEPYGGRFPRSHHAAEVVSGFAALQGREVAVAGRLVGLRGHGKATFFDLRDQSGKVQVYARQDVLGADEYGLVSLLDLGDIVGVRGTVFRTLQGEVTVQAGRVTLLAKALRPLPEKWHGLKDVDLRYRQRYLDLLVNPEVRETFLLRSRVVRGIRRYLDERGFVEVETPTMTPLAGGAAARPFVTHHHALDLELYLRIATELYLKRLVVGGLERVYEVGRVFRNEGLSTRHNPEFTMLEVYQAYADYEDMMKLTEGLVSSLAHEVLGTMKIRYQGREVDLTPPWARKSLSQEVLEQAGVRWSDFPDDASAARVAERLGLRLDRPPTRARVMDKIIEEFVEPRQVSPVFLVDYPVEISPLARRKAGDPHLTCRFEAFVAGREIANAFSELNDPLDQRERLERQAQERARGDEEAHVLDEDFLLALEHGMPPTGGLGIGVDRLVMLLADAPSIRDVILFPLLKPR